MQPKFISPSAEDSDAFYERKRSTRLPLAYDDIVAVKAGPHQREEGWIVSLIESVPEARYTVELCSGKGDLYLSISEIELIKRCDENGA